MSVVILSKITSPINLRFDRINQPVRQCGSEVIFVVFQGHIRFLLSHPLHPLCNSKFRYDTLGFGIDYSVRISRCNLVKSWLHCHSVACCIECSNEYRPTVSFFDQQAFPQGIKTKQDFQRKQGEDQLQLYAQYE